MIRLQIVSGSRSGSTLRFGREPIRVGRSPSADLRFHDTQDSVVSGHHAQIVFERGAYWLLDLGSRNGTWLNGRRVTAKEMLRTGDRIGFGQPGGPVSDVEIDDEAIAPGAADTAEHTIALQIQPPALAYDEQLDAARMASDLKRAVDDTGSHQASRELARQVAERRAQDFGQRLRDWMAGTSQIEAL